MEGKKVVLNISIHAPPRGATRTFTTTESLWNYFCLLYTSLREGRRPPVNDTNVSVQFQFTPLREGRRSLAAGHPAPAISLHAPPRGATLALSLIHI